MSLSPSLRIICAPFLTICFNKIGSRAGSRISSMFSSRTGYPNRIEFSKVFKKFGSVNFVVCILFSAPKFFIHLLAYPWGSIIRGHLLQLKMKIPFSIDNLSAGRPYSCHSLTWTSSERILWRVKLSATGIFFSLKSFTQSSSILCLYSIVKGPK